MKQKKKKKCTCGVKIRCFILRRWFKNTANLCICYADASTCGVTNGAPSVKQQVMIDDVIASREGPNGREEGEEEEEYALFFSLQMR